jgi:hypothetical protein
VLRSCLDVLGPAAAAAALTADILCRAILLALRTCKRHTCSQHRGVG